MDKPTIVFIPGLWESHAGAFITVARRLSEHGFSVSVASLASTGNLSPGNPSMTDDIATVRSFIEPLVTKGREVILVTHSAGGFIGLAAIEGLTQKRRSEAGKIGGVVSIAFLTAGVLPSGTMHQDLPFFDIRGNSNVCKTPRVFLFNDLSDTDAEYWMQRMQPQPATDWNAVVEHTSLEDISCRYLVCEEDALLPVALQEQFAAMAGATITRCDAGHMVMLSQPDGVVKFVLEIAESLTGNE